MAKPGEFNIGFNQLKVPIAALAVSAAALGHSVAVYEDHEPLRFNKAAVATGLNPAVETPPQAKLDDLRTGHHPVRVYYKHPNTRGDYGEFPDGQHLDANCKTIGQYQKFRNHHSKLWFRVNNERAFVNSIHVSNADKLQDLRNCKPQ